MSMSKKDFIALADAVKEELAAIGHDVHANNEYVCAIRSLMQRVADVCAQSNPRFMRDRWLGYISGENGKNGGRLK